MRFASQTLILLAVTVPPVRAGAEGIWQWSHVASGSGTANVFDGGPPVHDERETSGPTDPSMEFLARDSTMPGSLGASAIALGESDIILTPDDMFRFQVRFLAGYFPSPFPGGDNPGGGAEGELFSVIEFVMPADEIGWSYQLIIEETFPFPFTGSTQILVENVTESEVLLELTKEVVPGVGTTLAGETGDLIRITSMLSGSGSMGPGSSKRYASTLDMIFAVPEPETFLFLVAGALAVISKRRRSGRRAGYDSGRKRGQATFLWTRDPTGKANVK